MKWGVYHVAIFCFDLTNHETFLKIEDYMENFEKYSKTGSTAHIAIVGTKLDLVERE
jgi:NADH dehydrogenase FAD-containing subunit